jgi:hypothetical protein
MHEQWTYTDERHVWENEAFNSKEEAVTHAKANHEQFYIGQLVEYAELKFVVDNIEQIS